MNSRRPTKDREDKHQRHKADEGGLLVIAGLIVAYVAWRLHEHQSVLPGFATLHLAMIPPRSFLPPTVGFAIVIVGAAALCRRRWWQRRLARRVMRALIEAGIEGKNPRNPDKPIRPQLRKLRREGKHVWLMGFRMPVKGSAITLDQIRPHLEQHLDCAIQTWADQGLVWLRLGTRQLPRMVGFDEFNGARNSNELPIAIGVSREGELVVDLADLPHELVGGVSGGGKSSFLVQALTRLVLEKGPGEVRLLLCDLKGGMALSIFKRLPHLLCPVVSDREGFIFAMEAVTGELKRRMQLYGDQEIESLRRWNLEHPDSLMPYIVIAIDELAEISAKVTGDQEEQLQRKRAVQAISQIARLGRAVGIHMILCTQRPDAEIVEGQAKSNMGATLAFRTRDAIQSQILLGPGDVTASQIPAGIPGRGIWKWIDSGIQVQTPLLEVARARELLAGVRRSAASDGRAALATATSEEEPRPRLNVISGEAAEDGKESPPIHTLVPAAASFDVTRLAVGRRYEFTLADGETIEGVLRALEGTSHDGNVDEGSLIVIDGSEAHEIDRRQVVGVRRVRPGV